jgi:hypothetical protein
LAVINTDIGALVSGVAALVSAGIQVRNTIVGRREDRNKGGPKNEQPEDWRGKKWLMGLRNQRALVACVLLTISCLGFVVIPRATASPLVVGLT